MLARGRMLDVAGRATHVHDAGSGPAVLLLHGSGPGTTAAAWTPLAAALAQRHRVIAPDLAGFGSSEPKPASAGGWRETWLTQALGLLDALEIETCAVVGNSAGGAIALSIAHARPRAVTRVVAVGSMGHPMPLPEGLDQLWAYEPSAGAARALIELLNHDPAAATPDAIEARLQATLAQPHYSTLFPAAAPALGRRPLALGGPTHRDRGARPARARRAGPRRPARAQRAAAVATAA